MRIYIFLFLFLLFPFVLPAQEAQEANQFNAIDYILQKRPSKKTLEHNERFGDNMFVTGGIRPSMLFSGPEKFSSIHDLSMSAYLGAGKWFTPYSGVRLTFDLGFSNLDNVRGNFFGISGDYMLNLSELASYKDYRIFDVIAVAGIAYQYSFESIRKNHLLGGSLGLQGKWRLSRFTDIYVEPRLSVFQDAYDGYSNLMDVDFTGSLLVGINYNLNPGYSRMFYRPFVHNCFTDRLFYSVGFGGQMLMIAPSYDMGFSHMSGWRGFLSAGKWFHPYHGARLSFSAGHVPMAKEKNLAILSLQTDYLFNLSSYVQGDSWNRIFSLFLIGGPEVAFVSRSAEHVSVPGFGVGVQGAFSICPNVDLYVEPRFSAYSSDLTGLTGKTPNILLSLQAGLTYKPQREGGVRSSLSFRYGRSGDDRNLFKDFTFADRSVRGMYVFASGAPTSVITGHFSGQSAKESIGWIVSAGWGKWFSSVSGIRLSGGIGVSPMWNRDYRIGMLNLDYTLNLTSLSAGYDPERIFDLIGIIGASYAFSHDKKNHHGFGGSVGFQGRFNVCQPLDLFVEPRLSLLSDDFDGRKSSVHMDMMASLHVGANYKFMMPSLRLEMGRNIPSDYKKTGPYRKGNLFFSGGGGVTRFIHPPLTGFYPGGVGKFSVGHWFTPVSGVRGSLFAGTSPVDHYSGSITSSVYAGVGIDYLLNASTIIAGYDSERLFEVIGVLGAGYIYANTISKSSNRSGGTHNVSVSVGLQGKFNLPKDYEVFIEPGFSFLSDRFNQLSSNRKFDGMFSLTAGITYNAFASKHHFDKKNTDHNFISFATGPTAVISRTIGRSANVMVKERLEAAFNLSYGRWFTPVSGLRISMEYGQAAVAPYYSGGTKNERYLSIGADYMLSVTQWTGKNPKKRFFDLNLIAGLGYVHSKSPQTDKSGNSYAINGSIQGVFNVSRNFNLFIEPKLSIYNDKFDQVKKSVHICPVGKLFVGASYRF
ncbi:MAG: hypothetical protein PUB21_03970 [Bacteroidales bacterium]|nr:hypothetical protein [Bacteroidales bacterium]